MAVLYTPGHAPSRPSALGVEATAAGVPLAGYALGDAASDEGFALTKDGWLSRTPHSCVRATEHSPLTLTDPCGARSVPRPAFGRF